MERPVVGTDQQAIGVLLLPLDRGSRAINFNTQVVFAPVRNLRRRDSPESAVSIAQECDAVVIELTAFLEGLQLARHFSRLQTSNEFREMECMGADIPETAGDAGLGR